MKTKPRLILVCGPWSSGTTAVAGMLHKLGLKGMGPFFKTNDERTQNSYESQAFRNVIQSIASEERVELSVPRAEALERLMAFRDQLVEQVYGGESGVQNAAPIFLKYPLSAVAIPEIGKVFQTRMLYVIRSLKDIEATRVRREWPAYLGTQGAQKIYSEMFKALINLPIPTQLIRYPELQARPLMHARMLAQMANINTEDPKVALATEFVRRAKTGAPKA